MPPLILIVEDEVPQAQVLSDSLEKEGFRTVIATTGEDAAEKVETALPDLAVVDWVPPERSGMDVCRRLRERSEVRRLPIILLTARAEDDDRVLGLDAGADDYVVKPYSPAEMAARVRTLLLRARIADRDDVIRYGGIVMDLRAHKVTRDGVRVHLGPTLYRLLLTLMENPGRVYAREDLLALVWGTNIHVGVRTVDVHIRRLRQALDVNGASDIIRTVRSVGYALDAQDE